MGGMENGTNLKKDFFFHIFFLEKDIKKPRWPKPTGFF